MSRGKKRFWSNVEKRENSRAVHARHRHWSQKLHVRRSERGGKSAAIIYTLIQSVKLNGVDLQAWLTDTLERIQGHKINRIDELLPWKLDPTGQSYSMSREIGFTRHAVGLLMRK